jgi:hypothetical protein
MWEVRLWPPQSRLFPWSVGLSVLCLALVQLGIAVRNLFKSEPTVPYPARFSAQGEDSHSSRQLEVVKRRRITTIYGWIVIFFIGIWLLGFKVGALVLTFAFLRLAADERWWMSAAFAVTSYLFFLLVFDFALQVPLGAGLIADYFELNSLDSYLLKLFFAH